MKAFVMKSLGQVGFMEKPIPKPGPDDVIVKTTKALICTSDSHTVHGAIGPRENLTAHAASLAVAGDEAR
jgi:isopropanol dehydrogenase (NADP+)